MTTPAFARTDRSIVGRWWWTVDRWALLALAIVIGLGTLLVAAASPPVAVRIGLPSFYFVQRHVLVLIPSVALMLGVSLLSPRGVRRLALGLLALSLVMMALTFVMGVEIKGGRRWIHLAGLSIQPSEFLKPAFAVVTAWLFSTRASGSAWPGTLLAIGLYGLCAGMTIKQPDLGQTVVLTMIWLGIFFLAGLPLLMVGVLAVAGAGGLVGAYFLLPHVTERMDKFLNPDKGDHYQLDHSVGAFTNGGLLGTGPGQGTVKLNLPDAHADFIFAVAGEEMGLICTVAIVLLFAFVVLRGFARAGRDESLFVTLAASGLLIQFGLQALIHMGSSVGILPTKGMTLPFISFGGSSLLALGLGTGMMLALTRRRLGPGAVG